MESRTFNESGMPTLLFILGIGNRIDGANVGWILDRLTTAGYRVHAIQLSTAITDFDQDYRVPIQQIHDEYEPAGVLSHSLGGLITAFLDTPARTVYLPLVGDLRSESVLMGAVAYSTVADPGSHSPDQNPSRRNREIPL